MGEKRSHDCSANGYPYAKSVSKILMSSTEKTIEAINAILNARSVAVVGASSDSKKLGYMTLNSIIQGGYEGRIYPVNPKADSILGLRAYRSLDEIPERIELAVIIVPAKFVAGVLQEAVNKGTFGAVILSAGFREAGRPDLEEKIVSIAHKGGLRFVGPNVQGINYLPNKLCGMFFPVITKRGPLAVLTQSGSATAALSEWAAYEGLGISAAINLGNQADLCESDFLEFFATDQNTSAIAMYIEGVKDGRRFLNTLKKVTCQKPVVILKSGRTEVGRKVAQSHTGALRGSHEVFCAACRQAGAITADTIETLFDRAKGVACIRSPRGNRVMSISTSGGMGALAADKAEEEGLFMPPLRTDFVKELERQGIGSLVTVSNPLDLGYVEAEAFLRVALLADKFEAADLILLNLGDPVPGAVEVTSELAQTMRASIAVSYLGGGNEEKEARIKMHEIGIAAFPSPERAMLGIGAAARAAEYHRARPFPPYGAPFKPIRESKYDLSQCRFVLEPQAVEFLGTYGIPYPSHGVAHAPEEAIEIAERVGYPVVLKIVSPDVLHKTDVGGVAIGLDSEDQVRKAYEEIINRVSLAAPDASLDSILVCKQSRVGQEVIVGGLDDQLFGPTIMFGLGGIFAEALKDVCFRIAPLTRTDAVEMIKEIKGFSVLTGVRGQPSCDMECLADLIMNVSRLMTENSNIKELDLNPVRLYENGLIVLDARLVEIPTREKQHFTML